MTDAPKQKVRIIGERAFYNEVGWKIRQLRIRRGMTQQELANRVALGRTSITNIERGRQRFLAHDLERFSLALSVPLKRLLP